MLLHMKKHFGIRAFGALLVVLAVFTAGCQQPETGKIDFVFNPPEGVTYHITVESEQTSKTGRSFREFTSMMRLEEDVNIEKTGNGYLATTKPTEVAFKHNGEERKDGLQSRVFLEQHGVVFDGAGKITAVFGYSGLDKELQESLPPQVYEKIAGFVNEEQIKKTVRKEWEVRIERLAGRSMNIGDQWEIDDEVTLPNGNEIKTKTTGELVKKQPCGNGSTCVVVRYSNRVDSKVEGRVAGNFIGDLQEASDDKIEEVKASEIHIMQTHEILIEPETMLIFNEEKKNRISSDMTIDGKPTKAEVKKTIKFLYDYSERKKEECTAPDSSNN